MHSEGVYYSDIWQMTYNFSQVSAFEYDVKGLFGDIIMVLYKEIIWRIIAIMSIFSFRVR